MSLYLNPVKLMEERLSSKPTSTSNFDDKEYEYLISRLQKIKQLISLLEDNFLFK